MTRFKIKEFLEPVWFFSKHPLLSEPMRTLNREGGNLKNFAFNCIHSSLVK